MQISQEKIRMFQKKILTWYGEHQRDLPWRKTRDAYCILISEVMSQQTQLSRVVPKYETWMTRFPTVKDLANASVSEVLYYWSGLGYNRRALNLKKTAEKIASEHYGIFPKIEKELTSLPGIGIYTARAVLCFAFDQQVAVVDTNVRKVILTKILNSENLEDSESQKVRESENLILRDSDAPSVLSFRGEKENKIDEKLIEKLAAQLLPIGRAYEWNQALMDYSAAVLKKERIPISKQSKYIGSHRYYRSKVIKVLLEKKKVKVEEIGKLVKDDYTITEKDWLDKLLKELEKEGFIIIEKKEVRLV